MTTSMHPIVKKMLDEKLAKLDEKNPELARKVRAAMSTPTTTTPVDAPPRPPPEPLDVAWMKEATGEINKLQARCEALEKMVAALRHDLGG